jgi:hypothetical protein
MAVALDYSEVQTDGPAGRRLALVVTPNERVRVGRARLELPPGGPSAIDAEIVRRIGEEPDRFGVVLLRSWGGDESRSWAFDPDLTEDEAEALGYVLVRDQLAFFRDVIPLGVFALVSTDLTAREFDATRRGSARLARELAGRAKSGSSSATDEVDRWILDHLSLWTTRPFDEFVHQGLPELFGLVDRHRGRLSDLVAESRVDR